VHQADAGHADWIGRLGMLTRLKETAVTMASGETGRFISQPLHGRYSVIPLLLAGAALVLLLVRGSRSELRSAGLALVVAAGSLLLALFAAVAGKDYVLARNLLPALLPLLAVVAAGIACRGSGRLGLGLGAVLVAYWLAFAVYVDLRPRLQRPDWRDLAADIGGARVPREIVTSGQGTVPLRYYLPGRTIELHSPHPPIPVRQVDVVSVGLPPRRPGTGLPPGFRQTGRQTEETVTVTRYAAPRPLPVPWQMLLNHYTGFISRDVLAQAVAGISSAKQPDRPRELTRNG
jgi:hypothetical protein